MVSWVPELLMPLLVALAFFTRLPRKWVVLLAPTTFLSDIDYLFEPWAAAFGMEHLHRVATHTLLLRAAILGGLVYAWRRTAASTPFWTWSTRPGVPLAVLLVCYYMTAHTLMDIFTGGVVLFWPLWNKNFYFDFHVDINLQTGEVMPTVEPGTSEGPFQLDPSYPWLTNEHAAMLALVLAVALGFAARWLWRRKAARGAGPGPSTKGK